MKAIFFDRDGTLNIDVNFLRNVSDIRYLEGVKEGLQKLSAERFLLFIVTNQSGIARGIIQPEELNAIHAKMQSDFSDWGIQFEEIYVCPELPDSGHPWRKPSPGMILEGLNSRSLDKAQCWMVGDKPIDIQAGQSAGVRTILIHPNPDSLDLRQAEPDFKVKNFASVVDTILRHSK